METWLIFAIVSIFTAWFYNFCFKIIVKRDYDTSYVSIVSYTISSIIAGIVYLYINWFSFSWNFNSALLLCIFALWDTLFYFLSTLSRVQALKSIDTIIFFPVYKTFFPVIITAISFFIFKESLYLKDFLWILLWVLVPLLLITKEENRIQKNLKMWLLFILLTSVLSSISTLFPKIVNINEYDIDLFIFLVLLSWVLVSFTSYKFFSKKNMQTKKIYSKEWLYSFWILLWVLQFLFFYTIIHALKWNLAIVMTINSFSILIPIILSVIIYKEKMTYKKALVIALSILSVILFI